jgi:hypothetical protein
MKTVEQNPREVRIAKIRIVADLIARHNAERLKAAQADPSADVDVKALERRIDRKVIERDLARVTDAYLQQLYDWHRPGEPGESYMLRHIPVLASGDDSGFDDGDMSSLLR